MPLAIPHEWLIAETLAWPLVSEAAFSHCPLALGRTARGVLDRNTQALANGLDDWLRPRAGGWSLEALRSMREHHWFGEYDVRATLADYAARIASEHLAFRGASVILCNHNQHSYEELVNRWHWLSRALPADLLIAALGWRQGIEPMTETVHPSSPDVLRVLEQEVAETHLHVGAAVPFPMLWTGLVAQPDAIDPRDRNRKLTRGGSPPLGSPARFAATLIAAATARFLLAAFLQWRDDTGRDASLAGFWEEQGRALCERAALPEGAAALARLMPRMLRALVAPASEPSLDDIAMMQSAYRHLVRPVLPAAGSHGGIVDRDPLAAWLRPGRGRALPETRFAFRALCYLGGAGANDGDFGRIFWQYQRFRGLCFRHVVEEPGTQGLDWFSRHFGRIAALRDAIDGHKYRVALDCQSRGLRLASLEARTAPERDWVTIWREVRALASQAREWNQQGTPAEVGLVLHFIKETHCRPCKRLHADPRHAYFHGRYGHWFDQARAQARAIGALLDNVPEALLVLRGVDIANVELGVPTWVEVPLFHELRRRSSETARVLARRYPGLDIDPLRVTHHAGEDYRRLAEGLRRVHELIEHDVLQRGDRIGHGLALGEPPAVAAERCRFVFQPMEERLDDLLWEWDRYARGEVTPPAGREIYVTAEIARLAGRIYAESLGDETPRVEELSEARRLRHRPDILEQLGYPSCKEPSGRGPLRLVLRYLTDATVFVRGQFAVEVQATPRETEALEHLQTWLRDQVAGRDITVESNPTSNLVISDFRNLAQHPSFVLQPLGIGRQGAIGLSINTDNPLTFATCLANEYHYLYAALLRQGVPSQDAIEWLERARRTGWRSRFTLAASADPACLVHVERALHR